MSIQPWTISPSAAVLRWMPPRTPPSSIEETLEDLIQQRPLATVGLALGLGFLIGAAWRR